MDDIIKEFVIESLEGLELFDRTMLELEKNPGHKASLDAIFRTIHTVKGSCGLFGFSRLEKLAHIGENLLSRLRDGKLVLNPAMTSTLLAMGDVMRKAIREIEATQTEGPNEFAELIRDLGALTDPSSRPGPAASAPSAQPSASPAAPAPAEMPAARTGSVTESNVRVDVPLLDNLMNLVGELVLARNQIMQHLTGAQNASLLAATQRLDLITSELQGGVMKTRMQPIGNIWNKFPRIVRDVSHELGKLVELEMEGADTELDRTIIEAIKDPLMHILRNSIDHGIEAPAVRRAAGKPPGGIIAMRAFHEGGQVNIDIRDTGAGISLDRVRRKAVEKGILSAEQAARISDHEACHLIFAPGFSTAEKVTNVSGRGVGMDVVKTNIEKIGGSVDVQSTPGQGTTLRIRIPLTLAIIPALVVTSHGHRFAIPQISLVELVRLEAEQARRGIEMLYGSPVYRLRGQLLPLCHLHAELGLKPAPARAGAPSVVDDGTNIVVLQADGRQFGLIVDEINDTQEIVVKPLGKQLKGLTSFAGATIMGDGRVALILDVVGLALNARLMDKRGERPRPDSEAQAADAADRRTLLLFDAGHGTRLAIPLSVVARLEEIPQSAIERSAGQEVIQYRNQIIPLIRVSDHIAACSREVDKQDPLQVVVYSDQGRRAGLVVGCVTDIVDTTITVRREARARGILGSAVINDKITDLLDIATIVREADPDLTTIAASVPATA